MKSTTLQLDGFQTTLAFAEKQFEDYLEEQKQTLLDLGDSKNKMIDKLKKELEKLHSTISRASMPKQVTGTNLFKYIRDQSYAFELRMDNQLELPCYRNRIFQIKLRLVQGQSVKSNSNNILIELQIWSYENKKITHNNKGQPIFKGCQQTMLKNGKASLKRVQIREVSSHFPKGMFMLMLVPVDDAGVADLYGRNNEVKIDQIRPLIIQEVTVKAKKFSNRHVPYYANQDGTVQSINKE